jgi:homocysteine S-methyltransferase
MNDSSRTPEPIARTAARVTRPDVPERTSPPTALPHDRDAEVVMLDGGTATALEQAGHRLDDALWSARLLLDDPEAVVAVHRAFLAAGAQVVTTASYQLAAISLRAAGRDPTELETLLHRAVELGQRAVTEHLATDPTHHPTDPTHHPTDPTHHPTDPTHHPAEGGTRAGRPLVAASVGPYGAALADGSEYRGGYGRSEADLVAFHAPRVTALVDAGADVLACETIPSAVELAALARVLSDVGIPAYVSVTLGPAGTTIAEGRPLAEAFAPLLELDSVVAVGVNCCPPELVAPALACLADVALPLVAKPNAGARWDETERRWIARPTAATSLVTEGPTAGSAEPGTAGDPRHEHHRAAPDPRAWAGAGARLIGGCCGTSPADLRTLAARLRTRRPVEGR